MPPAERGDSNLPAAETPAEGTCAPRNTPTCDPNGRPVGGGAAPPGGARVSLPMLDGVGLATIPLSGAAPQGLDVDPATGYVYVAHNGNIISGCNGDTTQGGSPGATPSPLVEGSSMLSVVDPVTGRELAFVPTGAAPIWPLVDGERGVVWVASSGSGTVDVHALGSGERVATVDVGGRPHAFGLSPEGVLVVSNTNDESQEHYAVLDADARTLVAYHAAPAFPHGIGYDAERGAFYMVGVKSGDVAVIDGATGETTGTFATIGDGHFGNTNMLTFSPSTRRIFIADTQSSSSVTVVDADSRDVVGRIAFSEGSWPAWGMAVDEERRLLFVALPNGNAVGVADLDSLKPLALVPVDECPYAVRIDAARGVGYATGQVGATLTVFDLAKVEAALGRA